MYNVLSPQEEAQEAYKRHKKNKGKKREDYKEKKWGKETRERERLELEDKKEESRQVCGPYLEDLKGIARRHREEKNRDSISVKSSVPNPDGESDEEELFGDSGALGSGGVGDKKEEGLGIAKREAANLMKYAAQVKKEVQIKIEKHYQDYPNAALVFPEV